jgi:hypothetical protein
MQKSFGKSPQSVPGYTACIIRSTCQEMSWKRNHSQDFTQSVWVKGICDSRKCLRHSINQNWMVRGTFESGDAL